MSQQRSTDYIAPFKLARQGQLLKGVMPLRGMARLGQYFSSEQGDVSFEISFGIDEGRTYHAKGQATAQLQMECQRCMQPVAVEVTANITVAFVSNDDQAKHTPEDYEPCIVEDEKLILGDLLEDELILALPIVATHEDTNCQSWFKEHEEPEVEEAPKENPFAVLASLKKTEKKSSD